MNGLGNIFWKDFESYQGKSLEEKNAISTVADFYAFLTFVHDNVPNKNPVTLLADDPYFFQKAPFYLYPHEVTETLGTYVALYATNQYQYNKEKEELVKAIKDNRKKIYPFQFCGPGYLFSKELGTKGEIRKGSEVLSITYGVVELPGLKTRKDRLRAVPATPTISIKDTPLLYKAINEEGKTFGLKPIGRDSK